jgi:segregation and condensation protein A
VPPPAEAGPHPPRKRRKKEAVPAGGTDASAPSQGPAPAEAGEDEPPAAAPVPTDSPAPAPAGDVPANAPAADAPAPEKRRRAKKAAPPEAPPEPPLLPPGLTAETAVLEHKISLENFYGPLDLLLHLVREHEMHIETISIARIADQYCRYLEMMQTLDINLAGEFLVMAATLIAIKSRALVPRELLPDEAQQEDPSLDLIKKLIEYKRFKERARALGRMAELRARRHSRGVPAGREEAAAVVEAEPLKDLELWPLVSMFARLTRTLKLDVALSILYADIPIERFMELLLERLREKRELGFFELAGRTDRARVIGTFLAALQLAKDQFVFIEQGEPGGEIRITLNENPPAAEIFPPRDDAPPPATDSGPSAGPAATDAPEPAGGPPPDTETVHDAGPAPLPGAAPDAPAGAPSVPMPSAEPPPAAGPGGEPPPSPPPVA